MSHVLNDNGNKANLIVMEIDVYLAEKDTLTSKQIFEVWLSEAASRQCYANQQKRKLAYQQCFWRLEMKN